MVFATFAWSYLFLDKRKKLNRLLWCALWVYFLTELLEPFLALKGIQTGLVYNVSVFLQGLIWIEILIEYCRRPNLGWLKWVFAIISIVSFMFQDGHLQFNYYPFVTLTLAYISAFTATSFLKLNDEDMPFFFSDGFLLCFAPVLFFIGHSLLFAFNSHAITSEIILGQKLYYWLNLLVNLIFYTLINIYVTRNGNLKT